MTLVTVRARKYLVATLTEKLFHDLIDEKKFVILVDFIVAIGGGNLFLIRLPIALSKAFETRGRAMPHWQK